jgi:hypothetical protein
VIRKYKWDQNIHHPLPYGMREGPAAKRLTRTPNPATISNYVTQKGLMGNRKVSCTAYSENYNKIKACDEPLEVTYEQTGAKSIKVNQ